MKRRSLGPSQRIALAMVVCAASACGARFPKPYTAVDLARDDRSAALAHYLRQSGATAAVCDRTNAGPRFKAGNAETFTELTGALLDGIIPPKLFQRCVMLVLESAPAEESSLLLDELVHAYRALLSSPAIETDRDRQAMLAALHAAMLLRKPETAPHAQSIAEDLAALRDALDKGRLGPVATRHGRELLVGIDLERGLWKGQPVTSATLDALEKDQDEPTLRRMALRLPDPAMKKDARLRVVRLHIAASPSAHVRKNAASIEQRVMNTGRNAIDVNETPPSKGWLDDERSRVKGVLVRQNFWAQTATLLAFEGTEPGSSLLGSVDLRGALFVRVDGFDEPLTLCAAPDSLDPTPCLSPADLKPKVPIVYIDAKGLLHFVEKVTSRDAMRLVYETSNLPLPLEVRGKEILSIEWPLVYETPGRVIFGATGDGSGPDLGVVLERRRSPRLFFEVTSPQGVFVGVVEPSDHAAFLIGSQGAAGAPGSPGTPGSTGTPGTSGMSASCPGGRGSNGGNGGPGGNGGRGGNGGPGGPAGDISVKVSCISGDCGGIASVAAQIVKSEGGPGGAGGPGGPGGAGGPGGSGGSGSSCTDYTTHQSTYVSGGSPGTAGSPGSVGPSGSPGPRGASGRVSVQVVR